jgi:hypothetical protein
MSGPVLGDRYQPVYCTVDTLKPWFGLGVSMCTPETMVSGVHIDTRNHGFEHQFATQKPWFLGKHSLAAQEHGMEATRTLHGVS